MLKIYQRCDMQISSRFTIAVHVLICIGTFRNDYKITSDFLASSVNVNPVVIRRIIQQLKKAGIITVKRGRRLGKDRAGSEKTVLCGR